MTCNVVTRFYEITQHSEHFTSLCRRSAGCKIPATWNQIVNWHQVLNQLANLLATFLTDQLCDWLSCRLIVRLIGDLINTSVKKTTVKLDRRISLA